MVSAFLFFFRTADAHLCDSDAYAGDAQTGAHRELFEGCMFPGENVDPLNYRQHLPYQTVCFD